MIYVFDTNSFIVLSHYFPDRFPSFWEKFNDLVSSRKVISVREVFNELYNEANKEHLNNWIKEKKEIFYTPTPEEMIFVKKIFDIIPFQQLVAQKQRLKGTPVADPFIFASAKIKNACVITEEKKKINAIKNS